MSPLSQKVTRLTHARAALKNFLDAVESGSRDLHPLASCLVKTGIRYVEAICASLDPGFTSPIDTGVPIAKWADIAYRRGEELRLNPLRQPWQLPPTGGAAGGSAPESGHGVSAGPPGAWSVVDAYEMLTHLYVAARIVVTSRQTEIEIAMRYLEMVGAINPPPREVDVSDSGSDSGAGSGAFSSSAGSAAAPPPPVVRPLALQSCTSELEVAWHAAHWKFFRIKNLSEVLCDLRDKYRDGAGTCNMRCIVFVQQRITAHVLKHCLDTDVRLFRCDVLYATSAAARASPMLRLSPTAAREALQRFGDGTVQVLISTAVAEEGVDVPRANCVVRFDAVQTPVSLVQSRGRAREAGSTLVMLTQPNALPVSHFDAAEALQGDIIRRLQLSSAAAGPSGGPSASSYAGAAALSPEARAAAAAMANRSSQLAAAHLERVAAANTWLLRQVASGAGSMNAFVVLKEYADKVRWSLSDESWPCGTAGWRSKITLDRSVAPNVAGSGGGAPEPGDLSAEGMAPSKKAANQKAAEALLVKLREQL